MSALVEIRTAFARRGVETYGEGVSQLEHALQCAACAERDGASAALIAATLLHDIGHLVHDLPIDIADHGIDAQHESLGSAFLSRYFGPDVTEPVRLHVAAKRYLATTEPGYFDLLSPASVQSLHLQGRRCRCRNAPILLRSASPKRLLSFAAGMMRARSSACRRPAWAISSGIWTRPCGLNGSDVWG
jgi:[1-hydroxy-2-(trimethylamino)ethyl]phosphonate dioxygenase